MIKILFFGRLSDTAGRRKVQFELPTGVTSIATLKSWLNTEYELDGFLDDASVKTMVNQTLVHEDVSLNGDEEIGFLPPVGGG